MIISHSVWGIELFTLEMYVFIFGSMGFWIVHYCIISGHLQI